MLMAAIGEESYPLFRKAVAKTLAESGCNDRQLYRMLGLLDLQEYNWRVLEALCKDPCGFISAETCLDRL